jgi:hypothetical protein
MHIRDVRFPFRNLYALCFEGTSDLQPDDESHPDYQPQTSRYKIMIGRC